MSVVRTARSGSDGDASRAGSVLGTPGYMAPEQARGELERVDERADVFGLGAILCEILTGEPAFAGRGSAEALRRAGSGDLNDAFARLEGCGADPALLVLARDCLAAAPEGRPRDAGVVAGRVTAYLSGVQARVQAAERERAVAEARAEEERRRRKLQLGLAAALLGFLTLGGLSVTYYLQQRQARDAAIDRLVAKAVALRDQAAAHADNEVRWQVALAAAEQADARGDGQAEARLAALRSEIQTGLDAARIDRELLDRLVDIRSAEADDLDGSRTDAAYAEAFRDGGLDLAALPSAQASARIRARPPSVAVALAAALDDWANIRRHRRSDAGGAAALSAIARIADRDAWRNELRAALDQSQKSDRLKRVQALARSAKFDELGPLSLHLLGAGLTGAGGQRAGRVGITSRAGASSRRRVGQLHAGRSAQKTVPTRRGDSVLHGRAGNAPRHSPRAGPFAGGARPDR